MVDVILGGDGEQGLDIGAAERRASEIGAADRGAVDRIMDAGSRQMGRRIRCSMSSRLRVSPSMAISFLSQGPNEYTSGEIEISIMLATG